jgi:hypothetical protein
MKLTEKQFGIKYPLLLINVFQGIDHAAGPEVAATRSNNIVRKRDGVFSAYPF